MAFNKRMKHIPDLHQKEEGSDFIISSRPSPMI